MTPFEATLRRAVADLDALGAPWAMIGGVAVSARSVPRFTVRLAHSATDVAIDLLFASSGIEKEIVDAARRSGTSSLSRCSPAGIRT